MDETAGPTRLSPRRFALLFAVLFALAALPVLCCDTLPLFDYPNHLARMHILAAWAQSSPLQRYYEVAWRPLPNLAMDLVVPPLSRLMPLAWAGKAFVLATLLLLAGGTALLHRVLFGSWSAWSCLAFLLLYSRELLWGFLNYVAGVGLGLFALALWLALERRRAALRIVVGTVFALALYFAHLLACGLYGVLVMGRAAAIAWRRRAAPRSALAELLVAGIPFLPPLAVLVLLTPGSAGGAINYGSMLRKFDLLFSVFDNYSRPFDVACFALAVIALGLAFARGWVRLAPGMGVPLLLLALVYVAMPSQLATASGADHRIPLLMALMLVASSRWTAAARPVLRRWFLGGALVMFLARLGILGASWEASDGIYARLLPALDSLPIGSRLAVAYPASAINSQPTPLVHFPTLAVVRRDAFVPTLFAFPTQQPVALAPPYRALADRLSPERLWSAFVGRGAPLDPAERALLARYDYIVFVGRDRFAVVSSPPLVAEFSAPRFALFRIAAGAGTLDGSGLAR
ncbi:MAG TPA: hypothetical protein VE397_05340 [Stellaceae bacterium]|jgi:hypothetical protein|nr:hypothetical protein [Stellaceae bacterium]